MSTGPAMLGPDDSVRDGLRIQADQHKNILRINLKGVAGNLAQALSAAESEQYSAAAQHLAALLPSLGFSLSAASALVAIDKARELLRDHVG